MKNYFYAFLLLLPFLVSSQKIDSSVNSKPLETSSFQIYPNPATQGIVYFTNLEDIAEEIIIYDVFGEIVLIERITSKTLDISKLVTGVYVLQVNKKGVIISRKLIVK